MYFLSCPKSFKTSGALREKDETVEERGKRYKRYITVQSIHKCTYIWSIQKSFFSVVDGRVYVYAYVRQANSCSDGEKRIFECAICVFDENENESIGVKGCPLPQPQRQCASRFSLLASIYSKSFKYLIPFV